MPVQTTYPGVYVQEIPSGVRTITGVATSIAAFVDFFTRGPMNKGVQLLNMGDFDREMGGLNKDSEASYAIQQFFLNGGTEAWAVRVASGTGANTPAKAEVYIAAVQTSPLPVAAPASPLVVSAISEGAWGNSLRVRVEPAPAVGEFNLTVIEYATIGGRLVPLRTEVFRNLNMTTTARNYAARVVNDPNTGSKLVTITTNGATPPLSSGTFSGTHAARPAIAGPATVNVTIGSLTRPVTFGLPPNYATMSLPDALNALAIALQAGIRGVVDQLSNPDFAGATVDVVGTRLRVLSGSPSPATLVSFSSPSTATSDLLLLTNAPGPTGLTVNVAEYTLGTAGVNNTAQVFVTTGNDGQPPDSVALIGALASKTGIFALEDVDLFNILCIPRLGGGGDGSNDLLATQAQAVAAAAIAYCETRRAFFVVDTPRGIDELNEIKAFLAANNNLRNRNAALYYPRVKMPDPLDAFRLRSVGASGTIAGLYARTDATRGVWKAPAGTEAVLRNVPELEDLLSDPENGVLNPLAINCLRNFPIYGPVSWGARTLEGSDQQASEWKYVPVRRLALFLEESLYRGLKWVVFEPNDEPLWAQIRLNIGAFMQNLFRQGAFQGTTPREAYLVKCDKETTTQNDINLGIVNILVGFAPLKPAEFVIIKIQQLAGQVQT